MKRRLLLVIAMLAVCCIANADGIKRNAKSTEGTMYVPFLGNERLWCVWKFNEENTVVSVTEDEQPKGYYYILDEENDTVIDGKTYSRIMSEYYATQPFKEGQYGFFSLSYSKDETPDGGIFREEDGKVFKYDEEKQLEYLFYDFTLQVGDKFNLYIPETGEYVECTVKDRDEVEACEQLHRRLHLTTNNPAYKETIWIEGFGSEAGPLVSMISSDVAKNGISHLAHARTSVNYKPQYNYVQPFNHAHFRGQKLKANPEPIEYTPDLKGLQFEFIGDTLHITGEMYLVSNSKHHYMYCTDTEDGIIKLGTEYIYDILATQRLLYGGVDMYFPGFKPGIYYLGENRTIECKPSELPDPTDTVYASIWHEGSEWEVYYEDETDGTVSDTWVRYNLKHVDNESYMALEKTVIVGGDTEGTPQLQGYIQNDGDSMIYVRPVSKDGVVGEKCLLYDFTTPYEYGSTLRYGVDGGIREEYINWHTDTLDYYMLIDGDTHCLPSWNGIVYRYGYLGGPMELFLMNAAPQKNNHPKPTNISHVIFSTKGGVKNLHDENLQNKYEVSIPYEKMLTDGTAWECLAVQTGNSGKADIYNIQVKGDTIIGERHCKQVYSPEYDKTMTVFEEGRKVYAVNAEGAPEVLLDFGVQEKDVIDGDAHVACVEAMANQGYTHKTITIDTGNTDAISYFKGDTEPQNYYLIEGVGISKDQYLEDSRFVGDDETVSYLLRCWKGGVLVYQVPGYDPDGIEGVSEVANPHDGMLYDLQGRCLSTRPDKGFYISGNKKFIVR